ncbi:MAG: lipopolysaccharide transport system ATP-binding protein [Acidobacteriota bacterium]|jgi:lipopolysaccharide transport system ATP-binding protein|nr:lipopolysaccharide transport system ATP-binding protein [Acidobacteriota bacterium]
MRPIIEVRNLSKRYCFDRRVMVNRNLREAWVNAFKSAVGHLNGQRKIRNKEFWALRDIDFEVEAGEVLGIIGRNGAGKSTLLKILSRITKPTSGAVDMYGRSNSLLEIGTGFHPDLTGRENVFLNAAIIGMKRAEIRSKFDEIVAFAEVEQFLDVPIKYYSSGMYLRLAFAVAAHLESEILILDEVMSVGDAAFQTKCSAKMKDASREGRTVLFVSHDLMSVQQLCGRALLIESGELLDVGDAGSVVSKYLLNMAGVEAN